MCLFRYLATGDSQASLAYSYRVGKSTVSNIIHETCSALWEVLMPQVLRAPSTQSQWRSIAVEFFQLWNFPTCVGAMDGKHVMIQAPPNSGSEFYNYKGFHSIVLLAVCDAQYCFTLIDVGDAGRHSDGGIFANSTFGKQLLSQRLGLPPPEDIGIGEVMPYCVVADAAFPLKVNIMRPYPGKHLKEEERIFNYRLSRARRVIENTFGILSTRWRIFRRPIVGQPEKAIAITKAACCLHNYLQAKNKALVADEQYYCPPGYTDHEDRRGNISNGRWRSSAQNQSCLRPIGRVSSNTYTKKAALVREKYKNYFLSSRGQLPWQNTVVNRS